MQQACARLQQACARLPHLILRFYGFTSFVREKKCKFAGCTFWCKAGHGVLTSQDQVRVKPNVHKPVAFVLFRQKALSKREICFQLSTTQLWVTAFYLSVILITLVAFSSDKEHTLVMT